MAGKARSAASMLAKKPHRWIPGESPRSKNKRKSGAKGSTSQIGLPSAPASGQTARPMRNLCRARMQISILPGRDGFKPCLEGERQAKQGLCRSDASGVSFGQITLMAGLSEIIGKQRQKGDYAAKPRRASAASSVFSKRQAIVIGPTPPGTGVMAPAWPIAS